jgi:MFS family permease
LPTVDRTLDVDEAALAQLLVPRDDLVTEQAAGGGSFTLGSGPFDEWERRVVVERGSAPGTHRVTEAIRFRLAIPLWRPLFNPLVRRAVLQPPTPGARYWWMPPDRFDARTTRTLSVMCIFSMMTGYLGTLLTQTNTYFKEDFGASGEAVSWVLIGARVGGLLALLIVALADRRGRRKVLLVSTYAGLLLAATGALAPNLALLGVSQTVARSFSASMALIVAIIAVEEMPSGSRAFAVSVLTLTAGLGSGGVVLALQVAELAPWAWRVYYLIPLLAVPAVLRLSRQFGESRRYEVLELDEQGRRPDGDEVHAGHERRAARRRRLTHLARFAAIGSSTFLLFVFLQPQSNYLNDYLRTEQGYVGWKISAFQVVTTVPAGAFVLMGGALADRYGRRVVGATGAGLGALFSVAMFHATGWPIWGLSLLSTIFAAMAVPALGVYGPELFPTSQRGLANGGIALMGTGGVVAGLLVVGRLYDQWGSYVPALTLLGLGPLLAVVIIVIFYPETAHLELEQLNPEDAPPPPDATALAAMEQDLPD